MSMFRIFEIASQGMTVQRQRLEASSSNLANSNTTRTAEGGPYRRRDVVLETVAIDSPGSVMPTFGGMFDTVQSKGYGVSAETRINEQREGLKLYKPDHPDADESGYVTMPDVDPLEETVNMMSAARSFEANATAFSTAKELARASLRLGDV
jgi:flagellar basal-body rod protein FlgC